jgi:hypothetical protein
MSIDERLDRLTERHEALTQTVEFLAISQQKNEKLMAEVLGAINDLARIARGHEDRLAHLEEDRS